MELILIILGGTLCTAIIFMIVDGLRGIAPDDEDSIPTPGQQSARPDPDSPR